RNALAAGEGVVSRQHHNNLLLQKFAAFEFVRFDRPAHECCVEGAHEQASQWFHGVLAVKDQTQIWKARSDERPQSRKNAHLGGWKRADREFTCAAIGSLLR